MTSMCRFGLRKLRRERRSTASANTRSDRRPSRLSGHSVFFKNAKGEIFRTYGTFGRGSEQFMGVYGYFDVLPKGREEYGPTHSLPDWAKVHDRYGTDGRGEAGCGCTHE